MVEELNLERIYAQRGIELITPASGTRILDRLINQKTPNVIAINADWMRARRAGLGGQLPPMFSELGTPESSPGAGDCESSVVDLLSACPEADRLAAVADNVRQIAAAVFELAVTDIGPDDALDDIGLDSMMAMDFRLRLNAMFAIDLPLLELLRGVSVNSLAARILADLQLAGGEPAAVVEQGSEPAAADDDVDRLIGQLSGDELRALLAELEKQSGEMHP
jgi:acyl carrier protein